MRTYLLLALGAALLWCLLSHSGGTDAAPGHVPTCGDYDLDGQVVITDVTSFVAPVRRFGTSPGDALFDAAWDRLPGPGIFAQWVNLQDLIDLLPLPRVCPASVPFLSKLTDLDDAFEADPAGVTAMMNAEYEGVMTFDCGICRDFGNAYSAGPAFVYQDPTQILTNCVGEQPGTDCADILLTTGGQRCWQRFFVGSRYIADVTQPDVQDEIVARAHVLLADPAFDAYYVDVAETWLPNAADCQGATPAVSNTAWLAAWATLAERLAAVPGLLLLNSQYTTWDDLVATSPTNADRFWAAADVIEIEFGWAYGRHGEGTVAGAADKLAYLDRLHGLGTGVFTQDYPSPGGNYDFPAALETYGLAMFLITREDGDWYGTFNHDGHGSAFSPLYRSVMGDPLGPRYSCGSGCYARDYEAGTVTANVVSKTGTLP